MLSPRLVSLGGDLFLLRGRRRVIALAPILQDVAHRTGQLGAMHWLEYFLNTPSLASKPPYLILQLSRFREKTELTADDVIAAALFFEYRFAGLRTRVFCTDDAVGFRTVIAAREERAQFAERAACALLRTGAHIVLATYEEPHETATLPELIPEAMLGFRRRTVGRMLSMGPTYDDTLARMGKLTRRNLRYYRRRLNSHLELDFVADARADLSFERFIQLNDASLNPVRSRKELWLRWRSSCAVDGGFLAGLRAPDGTWLSLLGGWRHETTTVVHWQLNLSGREQDSIGSVIRSFFLEDEVARGTRKLLMFGGTPHSMRFAFDDETIADLVLCRPTLRASALRALARRMVGRSARARTNHLLQTLAEVQLACPIDLVVSAPSVIQHASPQVSHKRLRLGQQ